MEQERDTENGAFLQCDDPRRVALEATVADLARRYEAATERRHLARWVGPHKAVVGLDSHKALGLDESSRLAHAERFAGTMAERAALETASEVQAMAEMHARDVIERKDVA